MKILFHSAQLCERGTSIAMFDYAFYNIKLLGNQSYILHEEGNKATIPDVLEKFQKEFTCFTYKSWDEVDTIIKQNKIDAIYHIRFGTYDSKLSKLVPNLVHSVFVIQPHGERYAVVSKALSEEKNPFYGKIIDLNKVIIPYVPHMINITPTKDNMRKELNIPENAIVIGRHGGLDTFNIQFAQEAVIKLANIGVYFVFVNTQRFYNHKNIIHLDCIVDLYDKARFIETCDAMIHARRDGETFGLAVAEFSVCNKPIITCLSGDKSHIEILGDKALIYNNVNDIVRYVLNIKNIKNERDNWNAYQEYSPENVMKKFKQVFLNGL